MAERRPVFARDSRQDRPVYSQAQIGDERLGPVGPEARPIASAALRSLVLVAIAMLLILVLLPVALGAAWTQVATTP